MDIRLDDVSGPEIAALLQEHLREMYRVSPPESVHALDLESLRQPDITVWTMWDAGSLVGCGALKALDPQHAEIKSIRTASSRRRKGVAKQLLQHLLEEAKQRGYTRVSLETGSMDQRAHSNRKLRFQGFCRSVCLIERIFWSFYSTVRSDVWYWLAFSWPYNLWSDKVLRITVYSCANAPAGP